MTYGPPSGGLCVMEGVHGDDGLIGRNHEGSL